MKWNWGTKIALFYSVFVLFILGMVAMTFSQKFELVTDDYYAQELAYQQTIDKERRTELLPENLQISIESGQLMLLFPHDSTFVKGRVLCFRPSDQTKDFSLDFESPVGVFAIPLDKFVSGKYHLKIDWEHNNETFRTERTVIIPS